MAAPTPEVRASETREFSTEEEAALREGKLVVRSEQRSLGNAHLLGGMSWQVIDASPALVLRALCDVNAYPHFLPAVEDARWSGETVLPRLEITHRLGFVTASYSVKVSRDLPHGVLRFRIDRDRPHSIRDAWGELRVNAYGKQQSVVALAIMADLGEGLFVGLLRSSIHEWMLRVPEQLKHYVEKQQRI
jgi:hypothetical protein